MRKTWDAADLRRDSDGDGLSDWYEIHISHTDAYNPDTVGDGLNDWFRVVYGIINSDGHTIAGHETEWCANCDADGDGISNYEEMIGTRGSASGAYRMSGGSSAVCIGQSNPTDPLNLSVALSPMTPISSMPEYNCPVGESCDPPVHIYHSGEFSVDFPPDARAYLVQARNGADLLIQERIVFSDGGALTQTYGGSGQSYRRATDDPKKHLGKDPASVYCFVPPIEVTSFLNSLPVGGPNGRRCFHARLETPQKPLSPPCPSCNPCQECVNGVCENRPVPPCWECNPTTGWKFNCPSGQVCSNGVCVTPSDGGSSDDESGNGNGGGGDGGLNYGGSSGGGPSVGVPWFLGSPLGPPWQPGQSDGCVYPPSEVYASSPVWLVVVTNVTASVKIRLDNNNDRQLTEDDDLVKTNQAFRFWVNNDNDRGPYTTASLCPPSPIPMTYPYGNDAPSGNDSADNKIDCIRDLEDFAQMQITVDENTLDLIENHGYKVALVSTGPQVNVFRVTEEGQDNQKYLTDPTYAASLIDVPAVDLKDMFPAGWGLEATQYFIFEGKSAGSGELKVEIRGPVGNVVTNDVAKIEVKNVSDLYERVESFVNAAVPNSDNGTFQPVNSVSQPFPVSSSTGSEHAILFVHGSNNTDMDKRLQEETMFKRLYWEKFNGKFVAFRWPTLVGPCNGAIPAWYTKGEYVSFKSAYLLAAYLGSGRLAGYDVSMCAHSMGNMVASEALLLAGAGHVSHFTLLQAAVTAHCYDPRDALNDNFFNGPPAAPDLYRQRFEVIDQSLGRKAVNFYNPEDYALGAWSIYQRAFKPDWSLGYSYNSDTGQSTISHLGIVVRYLTDPYELLAFVARPHAIATGRQGDTQGAVVAGRNLKQADNFGDTRPDHSGQFTRDIMRLRPFYRALLNSFGIQVGE